MEICNSDMTKLIQNNTEKTSAEDKIKQAARELFTQKGFAATKTRDIAEKSGINLALLNYYFRSKQKLFDIIMEENMSSFRSGMVKIFGNTEMEIDDKIKTIVSYYIDAFIKNRDLPAFIIAMMHNQQINPTENKFFQSIHQAQKYFISQIKEYLASNGNESLHPAHVLTNMMSMIFFPFATSVMLKNRSGLSENDFIHLMEERKILIPEWVMLMMNTSNQKQKKKK